MRQTPLLSTTYHDSYLTGGCWSPSRPGVFYLIRGDGALNVWDYNLQQQTHVYQHKVHCHWCTSLTSPVAHLANLWVTSGRVEGGRPPALS